MKGATAGRLALLLLLGCGLPWGCRDLPYEILDLDFSARTPLATPQHPKGWLRVALAPLVSPRLCAADYRVLVHKLGSTLGRSVDVVFGRTHRQTLELLKGGSVDLALVGGGSYAAALKGRRAFGLAIARSGGASRRAALLVVRASSSFRSLAELRGKRFAFGPSSSHGSYRFPMALLAAEGSRAEHFFGGQTFVESADRALLALQRGTIDATALSGFVYDYLAARRGPLVAGLRVIARSAPYANPGFMASPRTRLATRRRWQQALLALHTRPAALNALQQVGIERFVLPPSGASSEPLRGPIP